MPYFQDKLEVYEKLSSHCKDNGLNVGFIVSELIQEYLIKMGVIQKK